MNFLIGWGISAIRAAKEFEEAMNKCHKCQACGKVMMHGFGDKLDLCWDCFERIETGRNHIKNMANYLAYQQGIKDGIKNMANYLAYQRGIKDGKRVAEAMLSDSDRFLIKRINKISEDLKKEGWI
jgi:ribosomal protein L37AE/L43A